MVIPLEVLAKLNLLNKCDGGNATEKYGGYKVPYNAFHVAELSENVDIRIDYVKWTMDAPKVIIIWDRLIPSALRLLNQSITVALLNQ